MGRAGRQVRAHGPTHSGSSARPRGPGAQPLTVVAATIIVLLLLVPAVGLPLALRAPDGPHGGALAILGFLLLCGIVGAVSLVMDRRKDARLRALAAARGLEVVEAHPAEHYAGSRFRDGSRVVLQGVRTTGSPVVEVGDCWSLRARAGLRSVGAVPGAPVAAASRRPGREAYLRLRLSGPVREEVGAEEPLVTARMHEDLVGLIGPYALEATGGELTVFGSQPLEATAPGRLDELLRLARSLADRAEERVVPENRPAASPAAEDAGAPPETVMARAAHPLVVVLVVLGMLIVFPLLIALIMSSIDQYTLGNPGLARLVVSALILVLLGMVGAIMRALLRRRPVTPEDQRRRRRRWRIVLMVAAAVVLVAAALYVWVLLVVVPTENDPHRDVDTVAECPEGDDPCQWNVAQRTWVRDLGYTRAHQDSFAEDSCTTPGSDSASCDLTIECPGDAEVTTALLIVEYRGSPWEVVGVRARYGDEDGAPVSAPGDVHRLVAEECAG
ncbi:hypothetical protein [Brachybacterium sp. YJGR34]|uniref:hypothetical protein n=1 Tax=Brachybacterium sp. YJGR34 TaxID=2059911 RepID=UPI000E0BDBF1|nr:hypothetical protein [Brachybacterium sp. YJGR34]